MEWDTHKSLPIRTHWLPEVFRWSGWIELALSGVLLVFAMLDLVTWPVAIGCAIASVIGWLTSSAIAIGLDCAIYLARESRDVLERERERQAALVERIERIEKRVTAVRDLLVSSEVG